MVSRGRPFVPNSFEIWPEVIDKILECFLLVEKAARFLHFYIKLKSLNKFERESINPVEIGDIPLSGLGGSFYWRTTEGRMGSWQGGHHMTTTWVKKKGSTIQRYMKLWKSWIFPFFSYIQASPEKILFLQNGADKLCKYIVGSVSLLHWLKMFLRWLKISKDSQSKIKRLLFVSVSYSCPRFFNC